MKNIYSKMNLTFLSRFTLFLFAGLFVVSTLFAQATVTSAKKRVYATAQVSRTIGLGIGSTNVPGRAIDADPSSFSTLNVTGVLATQYQNLTFANNIPNGVKVSVKIGIPNSLLSVIPNVSIQAYNGTGVSATPIGGAKTLASLLGALSVGTGSQKELTLTGDGTWKTIRVSLSGIAGVALSANVYEAYYETVEDQPGCEQLRAYDVISGVTFAAGLTTPILNVSGAVVNPLNAIDGDPNTYLAFNTNIVNVLGSYYATAVFRSNYTVGDKINLIIGTNTNLLNATVLSALTLTTYMDDVQQETFVLNSSLVDLELLSGGTKASLTISPTMEFNRATVTLNSAVSVGLFTSLRIYEISKVYSPVLGVGSDNKTIYSGHTATLTATPSGVGDITTWYAHNTTTPVLTTGMTFTTPVLTTTTLYDVYASGRYNCPDLSGKAVSTVTVLHVDFPQPDDGFTSQLYSSDIKVTGTDAAGRTYQYTLTGGTLPPGLTLNSDGTITGTPTKKGNYSFTVTIVDVSNPTFVLPVGEDVPYNIIITNVLPVTLEYFNVEQKSNSSLLTWATSNGQNNKAFGIERSSDATNWIALGSVESKSASGNSSTVYSFSDMNVNNGINYYRLKLVDLNGSFSYSKVVKVEFVNGRMKVSIYPNPTTNSFYIDGIKDGSELRVFDAVGKLILHNAKINNHHNVNLEGFANGSYFMIIKDKDNQTTKHTIIKK